MRSLVSFSAALLSLIYIPFIDALNLEIHDFKSITNATAPLAHYLLGQYYGPQSDQHVGIFVGDSTWGDSGAAWASLINYWSYTGDTQYNTVVQQALQAQVGPNNDYMPPNQTKSEGNDDQGFWALAAMTAAEQHLPISSTTPPSPLWLRLAQNVFDLQVARWDTSSCGGGLHWQIFTFSSGYNYKNAISAGTFFQLAARLARFTGNQTYADWAEKSYEWTSSVGLIDSDFKVYDGALISNNCSDPDRLQWTYNAATFLYGSAVMYNFTNGNAKWQNRTRSLLRAMSVFGAGNSSSNAASAPGILMEVACESIGTCTKDQYSFKGLAAQWMGATLQMAPFTADLITPTLQKSASGAAASCSEGSNGTACGSQWTSAKSDGKTGFGQQLSALNVILANLAANASAPVRANTTTAGTNSTNPSGSPAPYVSSSASGPSSLGAAGPVLSLVGALALLL